VSNKQQNFPTTQQITSKVDYNEKTSNDSKLISSAQNVATAHSIIDLCNFAHVPYETMSPMNTFFIDFLNCMHVHGIKNPSRLIGFKMEITVKSYLGK
jgi:hypothetical protein